MMGRIAIIAAGIMAGAFLFAGPGIQLGHAQSVILGPNGIQVNPPDSPSDDEADPDMGRDHHYRDRDEDEFNDRHDFRWREVRHRMREYRDECRDGDQSACIRLGIIIGQNQDRRSEWRHEHPDYFWWDRD